MSLKDYSSSPMDMLSEKSPIFYSIYKLSIILTYAGILLFAWYFIYIAYTIKTPSYDILCSYCVEWIRSLIFGSIVFWIFFLYFYVLSEIRFRIWNYIKPLVEDGLKRSNIIILSSSIILALLTSGMLL